MRNCCWYCAFSGAKYVQYATLAWRERDMRLAGQVVNNNFCRFFRFVSDLLRQFYDIFTGQAQPRHSEGFTARVRVQAKQRGRVRVSMRALGLFKLLFIN